MKKYFSLLFALIASTVQSQTLYFNNYDSLGKNDKVVTNATFEGLVTTTMVSEAVAPLVPTNRTITIGTQVGSLQSNLVFASSGGGVTETTATNIAKAVVDANVPTLAQAANAGGFAGTETITPLNIVMGGYLQAVTKWGTSTIDQSASGASQIGYNGGSQVIGTESYGSSQTGQNEGNQIISSYSYGARQIGQNEGNQIIDLSGIGAEQIGWNRGTMSIGTVAAGSSQRGLNIGSMRIGDYAYGSSQQGLNDGGFATNNGTGAIQIFSLTNNQHALTTTDGAASLLVGAGTISNKNTIVVGDDESSHGIGSITAGGGFFGSGTGITIGGTNILDVINQRVATSTLTNYYTKAEIDARPSSAPTIVKDVVISTNVVRVVSTQSVYVATVTRPCVITQDVSALTLATNQTAFWTTRINVTDWSATNGITFATNIAAYAGDFTVTGCYDFACSLLCDGRIEMRQTFPTVYEWKHMFGSSIGSATNAAAIFYTYPKEDVLFIGLARIKTSILAGYVYSIYYPAFTKSPGSSTPVDIKVYTNNTDTSDIAIPYAGIFTRNDYLVNPNVNSFGFSIRKLGTADISSHPCWQYMREANELEIKAYNNGWRPQ